MARRPLWPWRCALLAAVVVPSSTTAKSTPTAFVSSQHTLSRRQWAVAEQQRGLLRPSRSATTLTKGSLSALSWEELVYQAQTQATQLTESVLTPATSTGGGGVVSAFVLLYVAGLLTSLSPCSLGLLPVTVSYIFSSASSREDRSSLWPTIAYALGLCSVFCSLGWVASFVGTAAGGVGNNNPLFSGIAALVSFFMGFQVLGLVNLPLPSLEVNTSWQDETSKNAEVSSLVSTFFLGGSSALVASPCATPVLASILAFVAGSSGGGGGGGVGLLLSYTLGYSTLLLLIGGWGGQLLTNAATATATATETADTPNDNNDKAGVVDATTDLVVNIANFPLASWITPLISIVLLWNGTTGLLQFLFGDPSFMALAPVLE